MIKVKLNDVRALLEPLKNISSQEFPIKYSWKIMGLCENVEKIINKIEEFRVQLVEKYGDIYYICLDIETEKEVIFTEEMFDKGIDETKYTILGKRKEVKDLRKLESFNLEFKELLNLEEEILSEKIDMSEITDNIKVSAQELFILKDIFIFE